MDFSGLCRLCGKEERYSISIFSTLGRRLGVPTKIQTCLPFVTLIQSDNFPKHICIKCLSNLDTSYELYLQSIQAQSVIKNKMEENAQSGGKVEKVYSTQDPSIRAPNVTQPCAAPSAIDMAVVQQAVQLEPTTAIEEILNENRKEGEQDIVELTSDSSEAEKH